MVTSEVPKLTTKFLNDNNLWDSIWLMEKYPDNHLKDNDFFSRERNEMLGKKTINK